MKTVTLHDYKQRLLRVLVHIQQNLDQPLPLEQLAALACLSPFHFHRIFTGLVGESLHNHIRRLRLERAAGQLRRERRSVTHIAFQAGFETHESFSRAFRQAFGSSPSEYRKKHRPPQLIQTRSKVHYQDGRPFRSFNSAKPSSAIMDVKIVTLQPMRVAYIRHVGPYSEVGRAWDRLCTELGVQGLLGSGTLLLGLCHDDPMITASEKIRYDACATVDDAFKPYGDIGIQVIPGGDYAVITHFGAYETLNDCYTKLVGEWIPRSGRELRAASCFEVYINTLDNTDPEDLITDIYAPLEPLPKK
jgi:AraC family transcriptional regulator